MALLFISFYSHPLKWDVQKRPTLFFDSQWAESGGHKEMSSTLGLINSALVHEPKYVGRGGVESSQPMSTAVHRSQINFGDLTPYLTYGLSVWYCLARGPAVCPALPQLPAPGPVLQPRRSGRVGPGTIKRLCHKSEAESKEKHATTCPLRSRLQHSTYEQLYAIVDPLTLWISRYYPSVGLWIWPLNSLMNRLHKDKRRTQLGQRYDVKTLSIRVLDPHWSRCGSGSDILYRYGSGSRLCLQNSWFCHSSFFFPNCYLHRHKGDRMFEMKS
jgi:hypothetical protein